MPNQLHRGISSYLKGISWLIKNPVFLFLLFLPMALGLVLFFSLGFALWSYMSEWFQNLFPFLVEDHAWWHLFWIYPVKGIFYFSCYIVLVMLCFTLTTLLSVPILELVSQRVERDITGTLVAPPLSISAVLLTIKEESKKLLFIMVISITLLVIPGVNLLGIFISAFLFGWDYYDYPLSRRNYRFAVRLRLGLRDFWPILGLGMWQLIPFMQFFLMPLTIVGGTMLSLERLQKQDHNLTQ